MTERACMNGLEVLCVAGSPRRPSRTAALVCAIATALERRSVRCEIWNLADRPVLGEAAAGPRETRAAREFASAVGAADALVLASPVYHNSCTGLLKLALDELTAELSRKPVMLASSAASCRSAQALDHLRLIVRALGGIAIPGQVVSRAMDHADYHDGYRLQDPATIERVTVVVDELVWLGGELADARPSSAPDRRATQTLERERSR
jgi:NAD(P)H-dependent FMN reductase